jgi:hypothetical protein
MFNRVEVYRRKFSRNKERENTMSETSFQLPSGLGVVLSHRISDGKIAAATLTYDNGRQGRIDLGLGRDAYQGGALDRVMVLKDMMEVMENRKFQDQNPGITPAMVDEFYQRATTSEAFRRPTRHRAPGPGGG